MGNIASPIKYPLGIARLCLTVLLDGFNDEYEHVGDANGRTSARS